MSNNMGSYNPLSRINISLEKAGICETCGRRLTDPKCEHSTAEQREYTAQLDAQVEAEYAAKKAKRNHYDAVINGEIKMTPEYRRQLAAEYNARFTH